MSEHYNIQCADALDFLRSLPDGGADLVLTDPPYNVDKVRAWDKRDDYVPWMTDVFCECDRVTRLAGQLIFWHNAPMQMAALWQAMQEHTPWRLRSLITVFKSGVRALSWATKNNTLRSWFPACEYVCCCEKADAPGLSKTGLERIHDNPVFSESLRAHFTSELARAGLTPKTLLPIYRAWGKGGTGAILRHWFSASQYELPTREKYEGFFQSYLREVMGIPDLFRREYEDLRREYEDLRREYEDLRPVHNTDASHCNVWHWPCCNNSKLHVCRKPVPLIRRLIRVHSNPGQLIIDPFCGSGSCAEAALMERRRFAGCDMNPDYATMARERAAAIEAQGLLAL